MLCILTSSWVLVKCVSSPALGCLCKYTDILSRYCNYVLLQLFSGILTVNLQQTRALTAMLCYSPSKATNVTQICRYLDYVHVTTYDYHTKTDRKTGHNSPLFGQEEKDVNATWTYLLEHGAIPEKTVIGIPFYGRSFNLVILPLNCWGLSY